MWGDAQRHGRPAVRKVWLMPTAGVPCSNAAKMRNQLKLAGVPQTTEPISPLVGRSSPYCEDIWRRYCCLTISDCRYVPLLRRYNPTKLCDGAQMAIFLCPVFSASRVQHVSDLHSKFALRPHHVRKYGRHPICDG